MKNNLAIILINYKDYANKYLEDCLLGIQKQSFPYQHKLYIVDNSSSDSSYKFISEKAPTAEIIRNKNNDGFAKGNNDALKKAQSEGYEYALLLNMDTYIEDNDLFSKLIEVVDSDKGIALAQARLMLWPEKNLINSLGNKSHFLGFGFCDHYRDALASLDLPKVFDIFYPSGAAVLFSLRLADKIGLFDESFFMYSEDQDWGWRSWLFNYRSVLVTEAVVYHKYEFSRSITKFYYMDRNRIICLLKNYKIATLVLIFPAFFVMELGLIFFSIKNKWFKEKIRVWVYFLRKSSWQKIIKERRFVQKNRKVKDYQIIDKFSGKISYQEIETWPLNLANYLFNIYFYFLRGFLKIFKI